MAEAIVGPLVNRLQEVVLREVTALGNVKQDIERLRWNLDRLQAFIHDTDLRDSDELARQHTRQTREVAFKAEDAIDLFFLQVDLSRFQLDWVRAVVAFFSNFTTQVCVRRNLGRTVADLNRELNQIIKESDKYRTQRAANRSLSWRPPRHGYTLREPHEDDWDDTGPSNLVGRTVQRGKLVRMLRKHAAAEAQPICIVGERGIGKTTLVRDVYENTEFKDTLDIRIWTRFPPDTSDSVMVQLIYERLFLECFQKDVEPGTSYKEYMYKVDEELEYNSYLLVIDSPMTKPEWNRIRHKLPKGSKIVLINEKSLTDDKKDFIQLDRLNGQETKELFCNTVGITVDTYQTIVHGNVQDITRGQPLIVVLLAKLLKTKERDQWPLVFDYIKRSNQHVDRFWTILSLCFDDLSDELKSCLLYFVGFPENTVIHTHRLVHLWMAEGFLSTAQMRKTMEQLGQYYLKELISRGLVQLIKKDAHNDVELVAIHHNIHSFLSSEAQRTCFMEAHYGSFADDLDNVRRRRLSLHDFATLTNNVSTLRSMLCYFKEDYKDVEQPGPEEESCVKDRKLNIVQLLQGSPYLRVIDLEGVDLGNKLPDEIKGMLHLRYLGLRRCRSLKEVSASIGRLTNLQTFDVRGTGVRELPETFWKIKALRHVLGDKLLFPSSAGDLKLLQTLGTMRVNGSSIAAILTKMINLRSMHLIGLNESHKKDLQDALLKLTFLVRLRLSGEVIRVEFTKCSLRHLEYMELVGRLDLPPPDRYPSCILCNLIHLELKSTHVDQGFINMLALLPVLKKLMLLSKSYDGEEMVVRSGGFKKLILLRLSDTMLKKIVVEDMSALPKLESLELIGIFAKDLEIDGPDSPRISEKIKSPGFEKKKSWTLQHMQFINSRLQSP